MKHIFFTFLLVISSLPAFALDDFAVNSINAQNIKRIVSEMEIAIPHPSLPQSTQKAWQKEQSEACRSDWEHVNGFLSSKMKANTRLAEFGKEWDSADFVYHYFDPYINLEEGKNGTVYLEDIGLFDIVKNSAPSLKAKKEMDSNISQYLETLIANKTMGEVTSPELSTIANYVFVVFPLGRSTLYYYFSGNLEKNSDTYIANGNIFVSLFDRFEDPFDMDRFISMLKACHAPDIIVDFAKQIPTDCVGTVYKIKTSWVWPYYATFSETRIN